MKKPNSIFSFALVAAAFVFAVDSCNAQSYEFVFEQSDYTVTEGSTVDMTFLLRETVTGGETARLAVGGNDGLFTFGVNADFSSATGGAASTVASASDVAINAIFDDTAINSVALVGSSVDIFGATSNGSTGLEVAPASPDVYEIELATITVTAGDVGSVTTYTLADHTNTAGIFSVFTDTFIADTIATYGSADVTVTAVPEPTSALLLVGVAGMGLIRRRKR